MEFEVVGKQQETVGDAFDLKLTTRFLLACYLLRLKLIVLLHCLVPARCARPEFYLGPLTWSFFYVFCIGVYAVLDIQIGWAVAIG